MESSTEISKIVIDSDGDVILVLAGTELQVSTKVLGVASPVFKAMFGPHFLEGTELNTTSLRHIALPEDNPEAMTTLCNILHHRSEDVSQEASYQALEDTAVLCDKYDCRKALMPWIKMWMSYHRNIRLKPLQLERLLYPFYVFNNEGLFKEVSKMIVYHTVGFIETPAFMGSLHFSIFERLQREKWTIEFGFCRDLEAIVSSTLTGNYETDSEGDLHTNWCFKIHDGIPLASRLQTLESFGLWPPAAAFGTESITTLCERISSRVEKATPFGVDYGCTTCKRHFDDGFKQTGLTASKSFSGLCLECIKLGATESGMDRKCPAHRGELVIEG